MIALTDPLAGLNFNGGEERLINTEAIALSRCIAICQLVSQSSSMVGWVKGQMFKYLQPSGIFLDGRLLIGH